MACTSPILAVKLLDRSSLDGKMKLKLLPRTPDWSIEHASNRYGRDNLLLLPCGHCVSCRIKANKEWAVRCALEAMDYNVNSFLTLTYDDQHYFGKPSRSDIKKFIKDLRNRGVNFRYFGCAEIGSQGRWHYHMIMFGFFPDDAKLFSKSEKGNQQYVSDLLSSVWSKGLVTVGPFSPFGAQYIAGYVNKKVGDYKGFKFMSTRPGIGANYFLNHFKSFDSDRLILPFGKRIFAIPRYMEKLAEKCGIDLSSVKVNRLDLCSIKTSREIRDHNFDGEDRLISYKDDIFKNRLQKRSL